MVLMLAAMLLTSTSFAEFPDRRIQLIYPLTPGTSTYKVSQIIATAMGAEMGVEMITVAKPGTSGADALMAAIREPADGYTVIDAYVAPLIISPLFGRVPYSCKDFIPLYSATSTPLAIASRVNEKRWTDFSSFVRFLKENSGRTRYTGGAELSLPHLVAARMLQNMNAVSRHVTYADLYGGMADLRDGSLDWIVINPGMYRDDTKHLRVLAVLSELPDSGKVYGGARRVTDFGVEIGLSGLAPQPWDWWLVRTGTPDAVVGKLRTAMKNALARPDVKARLAKTGYLQSGFGPDQFLDICERISADLKGAMGAIEWEKAEVRKLK
jgi:tripartite-type tricarboxylate transporter receptor subunit TctC